MIHCVLWFLNRICWLSPTPLCADARPYPLKAQPTDNHSFLWSSHRRMRSFWGFRRLSRRLLLCEWGPECFLTFQHQLHWTLNDRPQATSVSPKGAEHHGGKVGVLESDCLCPESSSTCLLSLGKLSNFSALLLLTPTSNAHCKD